jgi:hypothetical protein
MYRWKDPDLDPDLRLTDPAPDSEGTKTYGSRSRNSASNVLMVMEYDLLSFYSFSFSFLSIKSVIFMLVFINSVTFLD